MKQKTIPLQNLCEHGNSTGNELGPNSEEQIGHDAVVPLAESLLATEGLL